MAKRRRPREDPFPAKPAAGNGLLDRRLFLTQGLVLLGASGLASQSPVRTIGSYWPYATTVFDYVRRAMPYSQPRSLTDDEVYAVTAYLLHLNGITGAQDAMNAQTLPQVKMPNREQFILAYPTQPR